MPPLTPIETTALYLFSSLLQADAALLAFGAVFVIYRLQSIENSQSLAHQNLHMKQVVYTMAEVQNMRIVIEAGDRYAKTIRSSLKPALLILAIHACLSAVCLWSVPGIYAASPSGLTWLAVVSIVVFAVGVGFSTYLAYIIAVQNPQKG
jgi:hypothetical protein